MALHDDVTSTATGSPLIYYTESEKLNAVVSNVIAVRSRVERPWLVLSLYAAFLVGPRPELSHWRPLLPYGYSYICARSG